MNESFRIRQRRAAEDHVIDQGEHRGVGADA
jgi:hypothetical protein